ncbi:hypothetical protein KIL84_009794 [Mauremys mutica]|uniref:Uncharacterized protein n=1 Tax=Mauremys mutica TaxID=74926 RepID=A0A9D4B6D7_9SAUR|nr:hypothetical protein KIL84_009794 [Mauremys mutica]
MLPAQGIELGRNNSREKRRGDFPGPDGSRVPSSPGQSRETGVVILMCNSYKPRGAGAQPRTPLLSPGAGWGQAESRLFVCRQAESSVKVKFKLREGACPCEVRNIPWLVPGSTQHMLQTPETPRPCDTEKKCKPVQSGNPEHGPCGWHRSL